MDRAGLVSEAHGVAIWPLLTVTVWLCAMTSCGGTPHDPESRPAAEYVIERGGRVQLAGKTELIGQAANLPEGAFTIQRIDLNETAIRDADLKGVPTLKGLQSLGLYRTEVTDAGLAELSRFPNLNEVELSYTAISDEGFSALKKLTKLKRLFLYGSRVTPAGVEKFQQETSGVAVYHDVLKEQSDSSAKGKTTAGSGSSRKPTKPSRPQFR